ncbi:DPY30 domain-containing protein 2, partial [Plecturocebus cupreus]
APRMETNYLKRCFGNCLTQALAEVAKVQPSDPIEYLAHWLYHYGKTVKAKEENRQEKIQLQEEYDSSLKEMEVTEILKQEEYQIQQKCEKCHKAGRRDSALSSHKHPKDGIQEGHKLAQPQCKAHRVFELTSETVSMKKNKFLQENTDPLEKAALKQKFHTRPSSMIPGMPQQVPPSESAGQIDWNFKMSQDINYQEGFQHEVAHEMPSGSKSPY